MIHQASIIILCEGHNTRCREFATVTLTEVSELNKVMHSGAYPMVKHKLNEWGWTWYNEDYFCPECSREDDENLRP